MTPHHRFLLDLHLGQIDDSVQMPPDDGDLLLVGVARDLDHVHPVAQRRRHRLEVVRRPDPQDFGQVDRQPGVAVHERRVLRRVEQLEQCRRRVAHVRRPPAHLVDLVEDHHRVPDPRFGQPPDDQSRSGGAEAQRQPAHVRLVPDAPQRHAHARPAERLSITFASVVLPPPAGPAKQRMGDGAAGRGCRTTMAAGPRESPPSPPAAPSNHPPRARISDAPGAPMRPTPTAPLTPPSPRSPPIRVRRTRRIGHSPRTVPPRLPSPSRRSDSQASCADRPGLEVRDRVPPAFPVGSDRRRRPRQPAPAPAYGVPVPVRRSVSSGQRRSGGLGHASRSRAAIRRSDRGRGHRRSSSRESRTTGRPT